MKFLLSSNPTQLATALSGLQSATIEAEYGDEVVEGSVMTMAHHGPRQANPCPCLAPNRPQGSRELEVVGLSHLDLDTLGACAAVLGRKPDCADFWRLAAYLDIHGPHKVAQAQASPIDLRRLYGYLAWSQANRYSPPRDGSLEDVTAVVLSGVDVLERLASGDEELLAAGDAFLAGQEELNRSSFVELKNGVLARVSPFFTNSLYSTPTGELGLMVVALRTGAMNITVSLADPIPGVSARSIVQDLWGAEAGGHDGIAGSPRGQVMGLADLMRAWNYIIDIMDGLKPGQVGSWE